jgi:hypothetical protein
MPKSRTRFSPQKSSNTNEKWLHKFSSKMVDISVGAHSCAMNSRLKAAPTTTIAQRQMLRFSWVRISFLHYGYKLVFIQQQHTCKLSYATLPS